MKSIGFDGVFTLSSILENLLRHSITSNLSSNYGVFHLLKLLKTYGLATEPQLDILIIRIVTNRIHKTAIIGDKSNLGENIEVGPYAIIENGSTIGDNCVINSHSVIKKGVRLGCFSKVGHFSVLGGDPQHLDFDPHCPSYLEIGENCRFGEGVTVHRSMFLEKSTVIHENCP